MKVLFACHDPPAPANNGGAIDLLGLLDGLFRIGAEVHLLVTLRTASTPIDTARLASSASSIHIINRNRGITAAASLRPFQVASRAGLFTCNIEGTYDVVISSDHCSGILLNPCLRAKHRIIRRQNNESRYASRMAESESNVALRAFYWKESLLFRRWASRMDALVDQVWYVSKDELKAESGPGTDRVGPVRLSLPLAVDISTFRRPCEQAISSGRVLYFGSFSVPINRLGVDWFVANVHPLLAGRLPKYQLVIAGRVGVGEQVWASRYIGRSDLQFIPNPANSSSLYESGGIFIDPRAHDVGVKVKIVEAVRQGLAVVCSNNSLVGLGLSIKEHVRTAETKEEFARQIGDIVSNAKETVTMGLRAQTAIRAEFDVEKNLREAFRMLDASQMAGEYR